MEKVPFFLSLAACVVTYIAQDCTGGAVGFELPLRRPPGKRPCRLCPLPWQTILAREHGHLLSAPRLLAEPPFPLIKNLSSFWSSPPPFMAVGFR